MKFTLTLFGAFAAKNHPETEIHFRDDKVRALLAYLAVEQQRPHRRDSLAEMLWGGASEERAQHSLRMALSRLRQSLGEAADSLLNITRQTVQLRYDPQQHQIDALEFEQLAARCAGYTATQLPNNAFVRAWMNKAVELYRGRFLAGLTLADTPSFDNWLAVTQGHFEQQALILLDVLGEDALAENHLETAEQLAWKQLGLCPWLESAHRQLMRSYARRGQWQLARQQYQTCLQALENELGAQPEAATLELFEQIQAGPARPLPPAPAGAAQAAPNNLPRLQTTFFGRELERARLLRCLLDENFPLITLTGLGGVGKTRLAQDAARHVLHQPAYQDGVWFIPMDRLHSGDHGLYDTLASSIASALGIELLQPDQPHRQLFDYLKTKKALLILDNFEQLIAQAGDGVDFVLDLLRTAPNIKLLVSSRRPLELHQEMLIALEGLPVPGSADDLAYTSSSVQLFAERGQRARHDFALDAETLPLVVQICRLLEGLPLGLELAAARLRELSCRQIYAALQSNFDLVQSSQRDLPARHRSLRAVFDWSWSLLKPEEQAVLAGLSVFRAGFSLEAAHKITGAGSDLIYTLIAHSLVRAEAGRYSLHELTRQFAAEKLLDSAAVEALHSAYYLSWIAGRSTALLGQELIQIGGEVSQEWENIQQAWNWACQRRQFASLAAAAAGLGRYLHNRGMLWLGEQLFRSAGESVQASPDAGDDQARRQAAAQIQAELARCLFWRAQYDECIAIAGQVVQAGQSLAHSRLAAAGSLEWGKALWRLGAYDHARRLLEEALAVAGDDAWLTVQALNSLGNLHSTGVNLNQATQYYQRALKLQKDNAIWSSRVQVLNNLATIAAAQGRFEQAIALLEEVLQTAQQFQQAYFQVTIYHNLGLAYCETGQYSLSQAHFQQALNLSHRLQNRQIEIDIWLGQAQLARRTGQFELSKRRLEQAWNLCQQQGSKLRACETLMQQALLYYAQGNFAAALVESARSLEFAGALGPTEIDVDVFMVNGYCCLALGQHEPARHAYQRALAAARQIDNPIKEIEALCGLAQSASPAHSAAELELAWQRYQERGRLIGAVLPYDLYLAFYRGLSANGDARAAGLLAEAQALLQTQAAGLPAEERPLFLACYRAIQRDDFSD